jgi:hypothetical protein
MQQDLEFRRQVRKEIHDVCDRMAIVLGRINLHELAMTTFNSCAHEHFKTLIIEVSLEFSLATSYTDGVISSLVPPDFRAAPPDRIREYMIILFVLEVCTKMTVTRWKDIGHRLDEYGLSHVKHPSFKLSKSMLDSFIKEIEMHSKNLHHYDQSR